MAQQSPQQAFPSLASMPAGAIPSVDILRQNVIYAEQDLNRVKLEFGADSVQYKRALKRFTADWILLKRLRDQDEFITELTR